MARSFLHRLIGPRLPVGPGRLHVCPLCHEDFVSPTWWEPEAAEVWRVGLRCGACGYERETVIGPELARMLDKALDKRSAVIARAADQVEAEAMAAWVESFSDALRRDQIVASDF
jgi:hypothetical protein